MKTFLTVFITALLAGFGGYIFAGPETEVASLTEPLLQNSYKSDAGFSFRYPLGHVVNENIDPEDPSVTNIFILDEDVPSPVLQMNVSDSFVSFALWEGVSWDYLDEVIASFAFEG